MIGRGHGNGHLHCRQVRRVLQSYLDGELDEATAGQVAHHLAGCLRCVQEAQTYAAIKDALARRGRTAHSAVQRLREFGQALLNQPDPDRPKPEEPSP